MEMPLPEPEILARRSFILDRLAAVLPKDGLIADAAQTRAY